MTEEGGSGPGPSKSANHAEGRCAAPARLPTSTPHEYSHVVRRSLRTIEPLDMNLNGTESLEVRADRRTVRIWSIEPID